ncbi:MAG: YigZ family protein [Bacteroidia bacterium]|nr:YigZ family protein [Bacteroidia bacterium]NNJ56522.1 YigZ family protein [Bacteroidia bacterium]
MPADTYFGITSEYTAEYKQSGSKFYGFLFPVQSVNDFESKIKALKTQFADATHVCSACVLEMDKSYQRFSDDGEPNNSAGRPILHALLSSEITYIGCAVVRYYGGKKLGIPGLIEAYGGTAQLCISNAQIKTLVLEDITKCSIDDSKSYLLYNYVARNKDVEHKVVDGIFHLRCSKSVTSRLRNDLKKINTLVVIDEN